MAAASVAHRTSDVFAQIIRRKMRRQGVTIRQLATAMNLTMKRVREVRDHGTAPAWANASEYCWKQDWLDGINAASAVQS
jgi:hypothetical protein